MSQVQTVLGPIDGSQIGFTLSHEHVLISIGNDARHYPWRFDWEATRGNAIRELTEAKAGGVDTMIELSTPDLGRDVSFMRDVARESGMNVIAATGIWRDVPRSFWTRSPGEAAEIFVHEIEVGIEETGIKAGVIKVANDAGGVTPEAERVLRGAARACKQTGTPISTHHWAPEQVGRRQVELFALEGTPMDRVAIGHSGDSTDVGYLETLLRAGVYLSMDRYPGGPGRASWEQRNETVKALIDRGWVDKLMLGHDHAPTHVIKGQAGYAPSSPTRYLHLTTVAIPAMLAAGVTPEQIHTMTVEVPRRFLTGES